MTDTPAEALPLRDEIFQRMDELTPAERKELPEILGRAAESARLLVEHGLATAQNEVH